MLNEIINRKKNLWINSNECPVREVFNYIKKKNALREPQIQSIEVYLYLKIVGQNKSLYKLFTEGFFNSKEDLSELSISQNLRNFLDHNSSAKSLYLYSRTLINKVQPLKDLENYIIDKYNTINFDSIIKKIFYDVSYSDYLFSLPMGAGKTYLMSSFIYLDLYFSLNEPNNKIFANNFLILIPSGLKSSIIPSLKSIEKFDPSWVLPEPAASNIKKLIKFEVLDQPKTAKKSNKARNPNVQKLSQYQPYEDLQGLVMVVNAEKVILDKIDKVDIGNTFMLDFHEGESEDTYKQANELRNIIGKIPNLQIHIDEVHHATDSDIKLRQVVSKWNMNDSINSVLGYSGTPYLQKNDKMEIYDNLNIKFSFITNTVYYYSLPRAIEKFLKKPRVEQVSGLNSLQIVQKGIKDFIKNYNNKVYDNGTCAKIAIYCGSIERLETEVFPFLTSKMKINPNDILKYHKGNKIYKLPKENELEFNSLDTKLSKKKIILLVQIGKEGWDCKSLTGVILSQNGDCPKNMVLQTSCRCLRQVDKGMMETALIWLSEDNAKKLDYQLKTEQHTSIQEINSLTKEGKEKLVERFSRIDQLKLPPIEIYQLKVSYNILSENKPDTKNNLSNINTEKYFNTAVITERGLKLRDVRKTKVLSQFKGDVINFDDWIFNISRNSFETISVDELMLFKGILENLFEKITITEHNNCFINELYDYYEIESAIRIAFNCKRELKTREEFELNPEKLLIIEKLKSIPENDKLYPDKNEVIQIKEFDDKKTSPKEVIEKVKETFKKEGIPEAINSYTYSFPVLNKDKSFHYLPYDFKDSTLEMKILDKALSLEEFQKRNIEIYYNGERFLTQFKIRCYTKIRQKWKYVGLYTPDFLIIERKNNKIHKAIIIETKGKGFAEQTEFKLKKNFVESNFLKMNNDKFGYDKFDYLYLPEQNSFDENITNINSAIINFFKE